MGQIDVNNASLNEDLLEDVYMCQPLDFEMYSCLLGLGFVNYKGDSSMFVKCTSSDIFMFKSR